MITGKFGRYIIKSEIGRGGMATVYHAIDPNFERDVAIKVLPKMFLHDAQFRTRFEREGKMIARLEHPAIVPVYDVGEEDGQPYIVMRYMSGGSLNERLEKGRLSVSETAQIISRLAPALDAAHARNIIHRDIKPGNVLFDQYGNAFLSDFGIARLASEGSTSTLTGQSILGTPSYMSPEQVQSGKVLDGRSDIYALGVLVYQMLTGDTPYKADTPAKVMMMHVLEPVPSVLAAKADLPPGCEALIARAMAKEPDDRFSNTNELSVALDGIARGDPRLALGQPPELIGRGLDKAPVAASKATLAAPGKVAAPPAQVSAAPAKPAQRSFLLPLAITAGVIFVIVLAGIAGLAWMGSQGNGPLAFLAAPTHTAPVPTQPPASPTPLPPATEVPLVIPTDTQPPPTEEPPAQALTPTLEPSPTPTPEPEGVVIGGADKIAWLFQSEIWIASLDGSDVKQLTDDGVIKSNLQWSPEGNAVHYISGTCVRKVEIDSGRIDFVMCLNFIEYLKAFEISPDGQKVAMSIDNQLYVTPYDAERLSQVKTRGDIIAMATCEGLTPYERNFVKFARWSQDSKTLALVIFGVAANIGSADIVQVLPLEFCGKDRPIDHFPPPRVSIPDYERNPTILNFGWDGLYLFVFNTFLRNNGFGDLYIYNMDLYRARTKVNPINNTCCYRDPVFSPDGSHVLFAYQSREPDSPTLFYLIEYNTIGTNATYTPLPLPPLTDLQTAPQAVLRPAKE